MLIEDYDIEVSTPACDSSSPVFTAKVSVNTDIGEVLPYFNRTLEKAEFIPGIPVLVWRENAHKYALRSDQIAISNIADRDEAAEEARAIVERINAVWENRSNLEPSYATWKKPKVLDVLRLLPGTNCRECRLNTCMAYAAKLVEDKIRLEDCPPLNEARLAQALTSLREMGL
jgi:ArsR family metal-binding transcriptional regulator